MDDGLIAVPLGAQGAAEGGRMRTSPGEELAARAAVELPSRVDWDKSDPGTRRCASGVELLNFLRSAAQCFQTLFAR